MWLRMPRAGTHGRPVSCRGSGRQAWRVIVLLIPEMDPHVMVVNPVVVPVGYPARRTRAADLREVDLLQATVVALLATNRGWVPLVASHRTGEDHELIARVRQQPVLEQLANGRGCAVTLQLAVRAWV